jgi:hypothetical protein
MCCVVPEAEVSSTRIFARLSGKDTQFLVYQMQFESREPTAMILPIPTALPSRENAVRFLNLEDHSDFFDYLESAFPSIWNSQSLSVTEDEIAMLDIEEVGDYIASFVPTKHDFERLDKRFHFSDSVWEQLPQYADYGFVVFQLKELSGSTHPMAFEFKTRLKDQLFFPTTHVHDGHFHKVADFDHVFYMQCEKYDVPKQEYRGFPSPITKMQQSLSPIGKTYLTKNPKETLQLGLFLHRLSVYGTYANKDLFLPA